MQYQVPQFIEVEDKIFGPLTLKQFIYLLAAGGIFLMCISLLPLFLAIIAALPFVAAAVALAFYKINERPLIVTVEHAFRFFLSSKLYIWKQQPTEEPIAAPTQVAMTNPVDPKLSQSKLKDLAWSLNIKDRMKTIDPERPGLQQI